MLSHNLDRHKRKPFSTIFRRLANLKSSSHRQGKNNQSDAGANGVSFSDTPSPSTSGGNSGRGGHSISLHHRRRSGDASTRPPTQSTSTAYSSPSQSLRSLTTLTTVQSTAPPSTYLANGQHSSYNPHASHHHNPNGPVQLFTHQYPTHSPHASTSTSAGPSTPAAQITLSGAPGPSGGGSGSGIAGGGGGGATNAVSPGGFTPGTTLLQPSTYNNLTSGGMLTDNASIITIASSSKRRRRSLDTDASIRALPPGSLWGGSRESLPLSVLSGGMDARTQGDRASLYSTTLMGGAPSIKDRDSVAGLVIGGSPLVSPRDGVFPNVAGSTLATGGDGNDDDDGMEKGRRRPSTGTSLVGTVESVVELDPDGREDIPNVPVVDKTKAVEESGGAEKKVEEKRAEHGGKDVVDVPDATA